MPHASIQTSIANSAARVTEVRSALMNQITSIDHLDDIVHSLTERLQPVLNVRPTPEQTKSTTERAGLGAPIADEIDHHNRRIASATQKLQDLLDWLEV